ncbi:hypothetical protein TR2A62_0350 [Thalassobium sp. R2A62]|nr:hypothetical protein TR2A62_0350 [Thalassobium sp. R2A62]
MFYPWRQQFWLTWLFSALFLRCCAWWIWSSRAFSKPS